jgi:hypothetical protein
MTEVKSDAITPEVIQSAYSYEEYRELIDRLLADNKTTGENHSEAMIHYTLMNVHRMKRLDKQISLLPELEQVLSSVSKPLIWLVLTEGWCGDAAQIVPLFEKMASQNEKITLRFILRDEHLDIMDEFLTNERSRSIPKLICLDADTLEVLGSWGPRPEEAQDLFMSLASSEETTWQEVAEKLHKWYADDKTESVQREFLAVFEEWVSQSV